MINDGERIVEDGVHWSPEAARFLYPEFSAYLDEVT